MARDFDEAWELGRGVEAVAMVMAEDFFAKVFALKLEPILDQERNHLDGDFCVQAANRTIECKGQSKIDPGKYDGLNFVEVFEDRDEYMRKNPRHKDQAGRLASLLKLTTTELSRLPVEDRRTKPYLKSTVGDVRYMSIEIEPFTRAGLVLYCGTMTAFIYVYRARDLLEALRGAIKRGVPFWRGAGNSNPYTFALRVAVPPWIWRRTPSGWVWRENGEATEAAATEAIKAELGAV